jgi:hypothetical protein
MGIAFFRRFVRTSEPPAGEKRPEHDASRNNHQAEAPTPMCGVWIDFACTNQCEWNSEDQPANEVNRNQN